MSNPDHFQMKFNFTFWVWEKSVSRGNERLVMLAIAAFADVRGIFDPSEELAGKCRMSLKCLRRNVNRLIRIGEIRRLKGAMKTERGSKDRYQLIIGGDNEE